MRDVQFKVEIEDGVEGHFHFADMDEAPDIFILDVGTDAPAGIQVWFGIEANRTWPTREWSLYTISSSMKNKNNGRHDLIDIDNIDTPLEEYPGLLALVETIVGQMPEEYRPQ